MRKLKHLVWCWIVKPTNLQITPYFSIALLYISRIYLFTVIVLSARSVICLQLVPILISTCGPWIFLCKLLPCVDFRCIFIIISDLCHCSKLVVRLPVKVTDFRSTTLISENRPSLCTSSLDVVFICCTGFWQTVQLLSASLFHILIKTRLKKPCVVRFDRTSHQSTFR